RAGSRRSSTCSTRTATRTAARRTDAAPACPRRGRRHDHHSPPGPGRRVPPVRRPGPPTPARHKGEAMIWIAIITGLLVLTLAALRVGIAVERRRNLAAWEAAMDQAVALTQTIRDADAEQWAEAFHALTQTIPGADTEQWAEAARALDPTNEYRGDNR